MQSDTDIDTPPDKQTASGQDRQTRQDRQDKQDPSADTEFDDIARAIAHLAGEPMPENTQATEQTAPSSDTTHATSWAVNEMLSDNPPAEYKVAGRTMLDVLVLEALNPLLQEWLTTHLPPMLEKALENELKNRELNAQLTVSKSQS